MDRFRIVAPHSEIDVRVPAGDNAYLEVDRPATEEPVVKTVFVEKRPDVGKDGQLLKVRLCGLHSVQNRTRQF